MGIEENKALVRRFMDAAASGEVEVFDEICAPDFANHAAPHRRQDLQGLKDVIGFSRNTQPDQTWSQQHLIAEGDLVVLYGVRDGTWHASEFRGIPTPTGRRVSVELAHMFRVVDGRLTEHWAVRDDLGMMQQLGALPAKANQS